MHRSRHLLTAWKLLIILLLINYQVVVILCNDFLPLKFLRDVVLIYILVQTLYATPGIIKHYLLGILAVVLWLVVAVMNTSGLSTVFVNIRKYLFPMGVLVAARMFPSMKKDRRTELFSFALNAVAVLAVYGVFQAYVLGDQFLIDMGYPTIYANAYKRITLNYSFYFGNLGIQRITATLSNSNVFGIILGTSIIMLIYNYKTQLVKGWHWIRFGCIALGYVLTFSRSNFLAMIIMAVLIFWRDIPYKKQLLGMAALALFAFLGLYIIQDNNGITHKLVNWVVESLTLKESSVAGRNNFWTEAWNKVVTSPLGIGFGKTGIQAANQEGYSCENSYLAMALDMGWFGCISYVLFVLFVMYDACKAAIHAYAPMKNQVVALLIYFMIVSFFSNHIYDMEAVSFVYFLVGITASNLHLDSENTEQIEAA